jgi:hypothetical protein
VKVGEDSNEGWWFSDGYGDYVRHFLAAMAAVPQWAPARENHLLRSTSIVNHVEYGPRPGAGLGPRPARVAWTTFDADSTETLRLVGWPASVSVGGAALSERDDLDDEGFAAEPLGAGGVVLRVRHTHPGEVVVTTGAPTALPPDVTAADAPAVPVEVPSAHGCDVGGAGIVGRD